MLAEFSIIPLGKEESVSKFVAKAVEIIHQSGCDYRINPMGTVVEGEWDNIMDLIKKIHNAVRKEAGRVITNITIDDRSVKGSRIEKKIRSLEKRVGHGLRQ